MTASHRAIEYADGIRTAGQATSGLKALPLGKTNLLTFELIPVGPLGMLIGGKMPVLK